MSRKFKKQYSAFNRIILAEFMTEEELRDLDNRYSEAKLARMIKKLNEIVEKIKQE